MIVNERPGGYVGASRPGVRTGLNASGANDALASGQSTTSSERFVVRELTVGQQFRLGDVSRGIGARCGIRSVGDAARGGRGSEDDRDGGRVSFE
jgi:hypothetical protein